MHPGSTQLRAPSGGALTTYVPRLLLDGRGRAGPEHWEVDGSLVFADVSGFTRLTERLARQGKAGAEEMVTTISRVFTHLLSSTQDGGDLLKFGGDALLILYTGADHAVRACHAAQGMQATLRRVGSIASSQGRVRLRMSVGIHTDTFPVFLAGDDDALELLVVGTPATTTVRMESAADAGEILVSSVTATHLDPGWLGDQKDDGVLLRHVPAQPPVLIPCQEIDDADIERFVPRLLRGRLGPGSEEHEHRRIGISFVHVGGVDALIHHNGVAAAFERVNELTCAVQAAVDDYGVLLVCTDIGADGAKFMLASGAPDASEDDAGRLLRTAHRIVATDVGLPIRAGVNHGHVFAGDVGAPFRRTYSTMGDTVNLAARVMGKAPIGRVLATHTVLDAASSRFAVEPVAPFQVKGKTRPVHAALVGEPVSEPAPRLHGSQLPLIGRDPELAVLDAAVAAARDGRGGTVELAGDIGAGKSRLVAELVARHPDLTVMTVTGDPYGRSAPYHVAGPLLRRLLDIPAEATGAEAGHQLAAVVDRYAPALRPWLPLLAIPLGAQVPSTPMVDATTERFRGARLRAAVADLIAAITPPGIVVVEAVEHVDEASAEVIGHVLSQVTERRWLALLTRRAEIPRPAWCNLDDLTPITVPPLSPNDAARLVAYASERHPIPTHLADAIIDRGGGNPLFLLELTRATSATPAITIDELPTSVESIIASSLDALDPDDRQALRYLSVFGTHAPLRQVDLALADLGVHSDDHTRWARLGTFVRRTDTTVSFLGDLARHVAYEGLSYRRRRELHGRVASMLLALDQGRDASDRADLALVAWHLEQAGRWAEAWPTAVAAGDAARAAYAITDAVHAYRRALTAARHLPNLDPDDVAEVAERCGDSCEMAAIYAQAAEAYAVARRATTNPVHRLGLLRKQGVIEERTGRYTAALRWYGRALREATALPSRDVAACVADLHNAYAGVRYRQGRLRDCIRHARTAAQQARAADYPLNLAHAHYLLDAAHTDLGEDTTAAVHRHEALPIFERAGDLVGQANVLNNLGIDSFVAGDLATARHYYERSRAARLTAGDVVGAATADNNIAELLIEQRQFDEAEDLLRCALRVWRGARYPLGVALACRNLGTVALTTGNVEESVLQLTEACELFTQIGAEAFRTESEELLAQAQSLVDDGSS